MYQKTGRGDKMRYTKVEENVTGEQCFETSAQKANQVDNFLVQNCGNCNLRAILHNLVQQQEPRSLKTEELVCEVLLTFKFITQFTVFGPFADLGKLVSTGPASTNIPDVNL